VIQRDVLNPLAAKILAGEVKEGSRIIVDRTNRHLAFKTAAQAVVAP
jgi:ATP-dependent Clp protease ATP-binding subunit ClpA